MLIKGFFCTCKGGRDVNQDNLFLNGIIPQGIAEAEMYSSKLCYKEVPIVIGVFDGLGGEGNGAAASFAAAQSLVRFKEKIACGNSLEHGFTAWAEQANRKILNDSVGNGATTAAIAIIEREGVTFAHLGDSRAYLIRRGRVLYVTEDHTEDAWLNKMGLPPKGNNRLTRYLGMDSEGLIIEPTLSSTIKPEDGDCILLCTDGVWNAIEEQCLTECAALQNDPADNLIRKAADNGSTDNCTAIVLHVKTA